MDLRVVPADVGLMVFYVTRAVCFASFFFFNDTATTEIYTLSLHDALPISKRRDRATWSPAQRPERGARRLEPAQRARRRRDRKSTRLNSSHVEISYAVFCLKKKIKNAPGTTPSDSLTLYADA